MNNSAKPRLHYMDMLKGIAIFMVVMGHVLYFGIQGSSSSSLFHLLAETHMPIFFFISGWFSYKQTHSYRIALPNIGRRAMQLIVPMVIVSTMYCISQIDCFSLDNIAESIGSLWSNGSKSGYWFTLVLFYIIVFYLLIAPILHRIKRATLAIVFILGIWMVLCALTKILVNKDFEAITSIGNFNVYLPIFLFGTIAHQHEKDFRRIISKQSSLTTALLSCLILFCLIFWKDNITFIANSSATYILRTLYQMALIIVVMNIATSWSAKAFNEDRSQPGRIASIWEYLGRKSLAIYLTHYFFLFPLAGLQTWANDIAYAWTPMLFVTILTAAAITATTILVIYIIERSPLLAWLLAGDYNSFRKYRDALRH